MKIAHLDSGRAMRGGQRQILALVHGLAERGHESQVLLPAGALAQRLKDERCAAREFSTHFDFDPGAARRAQRQLGAFSPDVVHAHSARTLLPAVGLARRLGVPAVASRRVGTPVRGGLFGRFKHRHGIARHLCVSAAAARALQEAGVPASRVAVVHSGVDLESLALVRARRDTGFDPLRSLLNVPPGTEVVGTVAAMTAEKRPRLWIEMASRVVGRHGAARFVWIGDGEERTAFEQAIQAAGLAGRVCCLGWREDALQLEACLTLLVVSSAREGLGTVVLDALALGVPVVSTRSGGAEEMIEDGVNGVLADEEHLSTRVLEALENPVAARARAAAGMRTIETFSIDRMVSGTIEQYRAVIEEARRRT